eukprot:GHVT01086645.1.p1 GENE.GHVT01086645.1~~GHVT01086645.1.p1  ORF type:complete len:311 (+),score=14.77 GHVT01086645.1:167-1099(+)
MMTTRSEPVGPNKPAGKPLESTEIQMEDFYNTVIDSTIEKCSTFQNPKVLQAIRMQWKFKLRQNLTGPRSLPPQATVKIKSPPRVTRPSSPQGSTVGDQRVITPGHSHRKLERLGNNAEKQLAPDIAETPPTELSGAKASEDEFADADVDKVEGRQTHDSATKPVKHDGPATIEEGAGGDEFEDAQVDSAALSLPAAPLPDVVKHPNTSQIERFNIVAYESQVEPVVFFAPCLPQGKLWELLPKRKMLPAIWMTRICLIWMTANHRRILVRSSVYMIRFYALRSLCGNAGRATHGGHRLDLECCRLAIAI